MPDAQTFINQIPIVMQRLVFAAILVAVEPLGGAVIGMTVFHESHDLLKLIGIALILGAIILLNLKCRQEA